MFLQQIDLTTALRPSLLPDEILLFVQDAVGLYEGKYKLPEYQNGQAYLTSHRACYVDNENPRKKAVAVSLKDVDRCELYVCMDDVSDIIVQKTNVEQARFLKSSPKITVWPKAAKHFSIAQRASAGIDTGPSSLLGGPSTEGGTPKRGFSATASRIPTNATWICPICSFSNPVPSNFDPSIANEHTPVPPCLACGIKPPFVTVVKAAIASLSNRSSILDVSQSQPVDTPGSTPPSSTPIPAVEPFLCPRCTFKNHPSLVSCEMCGASLVTNPAQRALISPDSLGRTDSPGPSRSPGMMPSDPTESIKFSFRAGGEKVFHEKLKGALVQRKWLLQTAPPAPRNSASANPTDGSSPRRHIGIAGLERRDQELRKNNEVIIGNAFEDLSALMASAKEIVALAETFAKQTRGANSDDQETSSQQTDPAALLSQLNLVTTRDMLGTGTAGSSLYLAELSRQLAEFLTDDTRGILKSEGGIISLVDLWAIFNRSRGGVELVSPTEFADATQLFDKLKLPVRLRKFKSGLTVVQGRDRTDDKTVKALLDWLEQLRQIPPEEEDKVAWEWGTWGCGVSALEAAERFGWSVGVAAEELEMAEERGALCREMSAEGVKFWVNHLVVAVGE